ncbi:chemotaxis protein CheW [Candidatus Nomurabacteria bacterium]|nr:chemotaxis protein CheW [Candidatus Nomurabacteria bacterium]
MNKTKQKFILFDLAENKYALEISDTYRIFEVQSLSPVPGSDQRIAGLSYFDGHLVTILATDKILSLKNQNQEINQALLVKNDNHYYAYLVDQVADVVDAFLQKSKTKLNGLNNFILINKQKIFVLETDFLLKEIFDNE